MTLTLNTIHCGDSLAWLRTLPDGCVQAVCTSPPYYALRNYGVDGQMGSEATPDAFLAGMVELFREVRRVLRDDGVMLCNIGDTAAVSGRGGNPAESEHRKQATNTGSLVVGGAVPGYQPGDMLAIPWRLGLALQKDGWILRQDMIWHKQSPMPESVNGTRFEKHRVKIAPSAREFKDHEREQGARDGGDGKSFASTAQWRDCPGCPKCAANDGLILRRGAGRCTKAHEYILLLTKSPSYFWDREAVAEAAVGCGGGSFSQATHNARRQAMSGGLESERPPNEITRNLRSVRVFPAEPLSLPHYAAFPSSLPDWCIRAATSEKGCCSKCGAPWARVVEHTQVGSYHDHDHDQFGLRQDTGGPKSTGYARDKSLGFRATCQCSSPAVPCVVLDPFAGVGTTMIAASRLGRSYIGAELNPKYHAIATARLTAPHTVNAVAYAEKDQTAGLPMWKTGE